MPVGLGRTVNFLFVNVVDRIVVRIVAGRGRGLVEGVVQRAVAGEQGVEQTSAAVVAALDGGLAAARGQVGQAEDGGISVLLVVHGGESWWSALVRRRRCWLEVGCWGARCSVCTAD